jgi:hypothetical protein
MQLQSNHLSASKHDHESRGPVSPTYVHWHPRLHTSLHFVWLLPTLALIHQAKESVISQPLHIKRKSRCNDNNTYPSKFLGNKLAVAIEEKATHLVAAANLDATVVDADRLHCGEQVLHRAHPRTTAVAPTKRRAELRLRLHVPHLRGHLRLVPLQDGVSPITRACREKRGSAEHPRVEPHARPAHRRRERLLRLPRLAEDCLVGEDFISEFETH